LRIEVHFLVGKFVHEPFFSSSISSWQSPQNGVAGSAAKRVRNRVAAPAAQAEGAGLHAIKRRLLAPLVAQGTVLEPMGHGLLLHGVHSRQTADAGLVEHDRSGVDRLQCV
jgi:hypothetical protein